MRSYTTQWDTIDLFHEGFIDRPEKQWELADARCSPAVYEIGERAKRLLAEYGGGEASARTSLVSNAHRQFAHSMMICECLASIEVATLKSSDIRFIAWPEIFARVPTNTKPSGVPSRIPVSLGSVIPDGLFGLEYQSGERQTYRFFALEADRGTMPISRSDGRQTSYLGKIAAYRDILAKRIHKTALGIPNLLVLTITTSESRAAEIMRRMEGEGGGSAAFLFKAVAPADLRLPIRRLLSEPWARVGHPVLRIDESD